eukprot:m.361716 g.361716  ORF g.361716 m.361716 type:complete len:691 (+) comp19841_c0_seq1:154-2226(+)
MGKYADAISVVDVQRRRSPSKHYVYVINVTWNDGSVVTIYRRYSSFFEVHTCILDRFPIEAGSSMDGPERVIPFLPGKKMFGRSHTHKVAQSRAKPLEEYLKALIELPKKISQCDLVMDFLEANQLDIKPPGESEREKKPTSILKRLKGDASTSGDEEVEMEISEVMQLDSYRAVANYEKQAKNELSFVTGTMFEVIEKNDNGWWFVSQGPDKQGWVPATFLEPLESLDKEEQHAQPKPASDEKYITTHAYTAEGPDEVGFEKGVVVTVLEKKLDGWWKISYQGTTGWTPGSYLERLEVQEYKPSGALSADAAAPVVMRRDRSASKSKKPPPRRESIMDPQSIHGDLLYKQAQPERPLRPTKPKARVAGASDKTPKIVFPTPKQSSPLASKTPKGDKYKVVESYVADDSSTISIKQGEMVYVTEKSDSGWWFITKVNGDEGWAPETMLEPAKVPPIRATMASSVAQPGLSGLTKPDVHPTVSGRPTPARPTKPSGAGLAAKPTKPTKPSKPESPLKPAAPVKPSAPSVSAGAGRNVSVSALASELSSALKPPSNGSALKPPIKGSALRPTKPATPSAKPTPAAKAITPKPKPKAAIKPPVAAAKPSKPAVPGKPKPPVVARPSVAAKPTVLKPNQYYVTEAYNAESDVEVSLKLHEIVEVQDKNEGWWFCQASAGEGWAPSSFLAKTKSG